MFEKLQVPTFLAPECCWVSGKMIYVIKTGPEVGENCLGRVLLKNIQKSGFSFDLLSKSKDAAQEPPHTKPLIY